MPVRIKRIYEDPDPGDGTRVLVDRLWPRGVSKEEAQLDDWMQEVAPSDELREWFNHDPDRWDEFSEQYRDELDNRPEQIGRLIEYVRSGTLTVLYAAADEEHNNAVILADYLDDRMDGR